MQAGLWWDRKQALAMAAQISLVVLGQAAGSKEAWLIALSLLGGISLIAWTSALRKARAIGDTATSKVASAAQGYVELLGRAEPIDGSPAVSPYTGLPCVWYHYRVEHRMSNNKWTHVESRRSDECFRLVDSTGACIVDPEGADVLTSRKQTWIRGDYRYTEHLLLALDRLYAIGEFSTSCAASLELDPEADIGRLLAAWKQDRRTLLQRFDANRDGEIDLVEWEAARADARAEVARQHEELRLRDGPHVMQKPRDGRLYLLSNLQPGVLARRSVRMAWLHLGTLLVACVSAGWIASRM